MSGVQTPQHERKARAGPGAPGPCGCTPVWTARALAAHPEAVFTCHSRALGDTPNKVPQLLDTSPTLTGYLISPEQQRKLWRVQNRP